MKSNIKCNQLSFAVIAWAVAGLSIVTGSAHAQFFEGDDVRPRNSSGKIVTDVVNDVNGTVTANARVFSLRFQQRVNDPFFMDLPGFNASSGSGLINASLTFNILSGLSYWDGVGAYQAMPVPSGEVLRLNRGATNRFISGVSGAQNGLSLGNVSSTGSIHVHVNAFLNGSDGNAVPANGLPNAVPPRPADGVEAAAGLYVTSIQLLQPTTGLTASDPLYLVYGNHLDAARINRASAELRNTAAAGTNIAALPEETWTGPSIGGNWGNTSLWSTGVIPDRDSAVANFFGGPAGTTAVNLEQPRRVSTLQFDSGINSTSYALSGSALTLGARVGRYEVNVLAGQHQISSGVISSGRGVVNVSAGAALTLSGGLTPGMTTPALFEKAGEGELSITTAFAAGRVEVEAGLLSLDVPLANVGTSLTVSAGAVLGTGASDFVLDYDENLTGSPLAQLLSYQQDGRLQSAGDLFGVSAVLALVEASELGVTEFGGMALSGDAVIGKFTFAGDANLDDRVDAFDYATVDDNFGSAGFGLPNGDLNLDGLVDAFDYATIDDTFGASLPVGIVQAGGFTEVFIPEPAGMALLLAAAPLLQRRRIAR